MKRLLQILLPLLVLAASLWLARQIIAAKPEATRRDTPTRLVDIEAVRVKPVSYQVRINSQGTVQPRTESTLISELAGRIVELAPNFQNGGFFEQGDVLVHLDPRDYEIAVTVAASELAGVEAALAEEQARAKVAERDWRQLKRDAGANQLVLRKPQVAAARAAVLAAEAQLARAQLNLERTRITAPYAGRLLEQSVGLGQYVGAGTVLGRIYAVDYVEIRLPLSNRQLAFIDLPEQYRGDPDHIPGPAVTLRARIGATDYHWQGQLIRAEGAIDTQSRQLFVVAQVDDPYGRGPQQRPPLRIGQFVQAEISGRTLTDVIVIARTALREGDQVLLVNNDNLLTRRTVDVIWRDSANVVIGSGLNSGDALVLTPLSTAAEGTPVRVRYREQAAPEAERSTRSDSPLNSPTAALLTPAGSVGAE